MATLVLKDAVVIFGSGTGATLSDHVRSVELPLEVDAVDNTYMGDSTKHSIPGMKSGDISCNFGQDFAANKVDSFIWTKWNAGTVATLTVKATSSATSATNPAYKANVYVKDYTPISGSVGDLAEAPVNFTISTGNVTRATA